MYGRWIVLVLAVLIMVVVLFGFSTQLYNALMVFFIGVLSVIEVRKFLRDKRAFRLLLLIPLCIVVVFVTPMLTLFSKDVLISLKVLGSAVILLYFFYDFRTRSTL